MFSSSHAPGHASRRPAAIASWAVIVLATLLLYGLHTGPANDAPTPDELARPDRELLVAARSAVGQHQLAKRFPALEAPYESTLAGLSIQAESAADRLRVAIVEAELAGRERALRRVDTLLEEQDAWPEALLDDAQLVRAILDEELDYDRIGASQSRGLIDRHGWFGELALTHAAEAPDELGQQVRRGAQRSFLTLMGLSVAVLVLGVLGLGLFIAALVMIGNGKLRWHYRRPRRGAVAFLEAFALFMAVMVLFAAGGYLARGTAAEPVMGLVGLLSAPLMLLTLAWPLWRGVRFRRWWLGLGLYRGRGFWRECGLGLVGYVAGIPIVFAGFVLSTVMIRWLPEAPTHPVAEELPRAGVFELVVLFLMAVVWAPLIEELAFRGAFYHALRRWVGMVMAALAVGLIFAAVHPQGLAGIPVLMALAVVFALVREWRGTMVAPIAGHAVHNLMVMLAGLLMLYG